MISQFDYLARYAGYVSIADKLEDFTNPNVKEAPNFISLSREILENTPTIPADGELGQMFGVDPDFGTFTFPNDVINSSKKILENHFLLNRNEKIDSKNSNSNNICYDKNNQILVSGDTIPSLSSFSTKINNLKSSIEKGMPVIWWTLGGNKAEGFSNHYMNIFGYEYWEGIDSSNNIKKHLMFKLRYNWGEEDVYMDSDVLDAINGGFIFFEETNKKTLVRPENYGYDCKYFFKETDKVVSPALGNTLNTRYLRSGYVNRYDSSNTTIIDHQIFLSEKKTNAGEAYIQYEVAYPIKWLYLEVCWWSSFEGINASNGQAGIEYKNHDGKWVKQYDFFNDVDANISNLIENKTKIKCSFEYSVSEFKIYVKTDYPSGDRNKGRLVLGNLLLFHNEFEHSCTHSFMHHYENLGFTIPYHKAYCECGEFIEQNHSYNNVWISSGKVMGICTKCKTTCLIRILSYSEIKLYNANLLNISSFS